MPTQGQGVAAQSMIPPHNVSYDGARVSELARAEPARAKSLLDRESGWRGASGTAGCRSRCWTRAHAPPPRDACHRHQPGQP